MEELNEIDIIKMSLLDAYRAFCMLEHDDQKPARWNETYDKVRNGIEIPFDIYSVLDKETHRKAKNGILIVENKQMRLKDFNTEMEKRESLIKKTLKDTLYKPDIYGPRRPLMARS